MPTYPFTLIGVRYQVPVKMTKKLVHSLYIRIFPRFYRFAILGLALLGARHAHAQDPPVSIGNPLAAGTLVEFLEALVRVVIQLSIPVAAMFIIYSGFLFVTARGSDTQIVKAKQTFFWAIIGTALLIGAQIVITVVTGTVADLELE